MTRKIKFKAKRKDNNEWVYGYIIKSFKTDKYFMVTDEDTTKDYWNSKPLPEIIPEKMCEYTGLKDKNGVEIYENDILQATYEDKGKFYFKVEYLPSSCMFILTNEEYMASVTFEDVSNIEIIGNIYDKE